MTNVQTEADAPVVSGDVGLSFLEGKTNALAVVESEPDPFIEALIDKARPFLPDAPAPGLLSRAWRGIVRAAFALRRAAAAALVNAPARSDVVAYVRRYRRGERLRVVRYGDTGRMTRVGCHRARRAWFGRQRSTSERNAANAAASRAAAAPSKEGDLPWVPPHYLSWFENFVETLRCEDEVLHREPGRHFICS